MHILHISAECYPVAKAGGLGDVVGALPKYLNQSGIKASVVLPNYKNKFLGEHRWTTVHSGSIQFGLQHHPYHILKEQSGELGFDFYEVEIPGLLEEPLPYGYANDAERHVAFQIAVADWFNAWQQLPDVIHCHDHHTALLPFIMDHCFMYQRLKDIPTVFTIHNGNYQGRMGWDQSWMLPAFDWNNRGMLEWDNDINPMASAIRCAWKVTTVSPGYMEELRTSSLGLEKLFNDERQKTLGILNGIDTDVWNPKTDALIASNYGKKHFPEGKAVNKKALCQTFGLDDTLPLFVFIGRLVDEKGADLLATAITQCIGELEGRISFIVLGSGMNEYEADIKALRKSFPQNFNCFIGYNEQLSHQLYAGADFLLMPSRVEPCGLTQLYAMRYGTMPIVRSVGGLKDTVTDVGDAGGFGIRFEQAASSEIFHSVTRAAVLFEDPELLNSMRKKMMGIDHSWESAAKEYISLYESLKQ